MGATKIQMVHLTHTETICFTDFRDGQGKGVVSGCGYSGDKGHRGNETHHPPLEVPAPPLEVPPLGIPPLEVLRADPGGREKEEDICYFPPC